MRTRLLCALVMATVILAADLQPVAAIAAEAPRPQALWSLYPLDHAAQDRAGHRMVRVGVPPGYVDVTSDRDDTGSGGSTALNPVVVVVASCLLAAALVFYLRGRALTQRAAAPPALLDRLGGGPRRRRDRPRTERGQPHPTSSPSAAAERTVSDRPASAAPVAAAEPRATGPPADGEAATTVAPPTGATVVGYISLTAAEQDAGVPGLVEQELLIRERCEREGWKLTAVLCDSANMLAEGKERTALAATLERLREAEQPCLVVSRLDRLGRSAVELAEAMESLGRLGAVVVALDYAIDTASPTGGLIAEVLNGVADRDRERIAAGTRSGHALARSQGRPISRPSVNDSPTLRARIVAMREQGMTLQAIADRLNEEGVPTVRGGAKWRPSSVQGAAGYKRPPAGSGSGRSPRKPARGDARRDGQTP